MSALARVEQIKSHLFPSPLTPIPNFVTATSQAPHDSATIDKVIIWLSSGVLYSSPNNGSGRVSCNDAVIALRRLYEVNPKIPKVIKWCLLVPTDKNTSYVSLVQFVNPHVQTTLEAAEQIEGYIKQGMDYLTNLRINHKL